MEFFKCSIGGEVYGTGITEIERGIAEQNGLKVEEVCLHCSISHAVVNEDTRPGQLRECCFAGTQISQCCSRKGI